MSADNRICIMEWMGKWFVWHGNGSTNYYEPPYHETEMFETREAALLFADEEEKRIEYLEYGTTFIGKNEQRAGLIDKIGLLTKRLQDLDKHGEQYHFEPSEQI